MRFQSKVFFAIFTTSAALGSVLAFAAYRTFSHHLVDSYTHQYEAMNELIGNTLVQMEKTTELLSMNAAQYLQEYEAQYGLPETEALRKLAAKLNVTDIYATDKTGHFIRDTKFPV